MIPFIIYESSKYRRCHDDLQKVVPRFKKKKG